MFIEILEKTLKEKNLTLNKMAKAIGIAQSPTSRWKKGSLPSVEVLKQICQYLNVSADYLLELEPPPDITDKEKTLLEHYRKADKRGKEYIIETAKREAARNDNPETKSYNSKVG